MTRVRYLRSVSERLQQEPLFKESFLEEAYSRGLLTPTMLRKKLSLLRGIEKAQKDLPYFLMTKNMVTMKLALEAELGPKGLTRTNKVA
jgi:hypothetical protein